MLGNMKARGAELKLLTKQNKTMNKTVIEMSLSPSKVSIKESDGRNAHVYQNRYCLEGAISEALSKGAKKSGKV